MSDTKAIHTVNARDNVMLEVMQDVFNLSSDHMYREIRLMRDQLDGVLSNKGVKYADLRTALVPQPDRMEAAFVFDSMLISNSWYGYEVFTRLIPLLDKKSNHSILSGDYIDQARGQDVMFDAFQEALRPARQVTYQHSSQFYIVYINNLTRAMVQKLDDGLQDFEAYAGFADTTYASRFKLLLSTMLPSLCVKHKGVVIQGHEDDRPNSEDVNMSGYPFEENGYVCRSLQSALEGVLLSYKIERPVFAGFESDTEFSLNAVTTEPKPLHDFEIEVENAKLEYLKSEKAGSLKRAGLESVTTDELQGIIRRRISENYIYSLSRNDNHDVTKFNIIIEVARSASNNPCRLLAALEYKAETNTLRLITLY